MDIQTLAEKIGFEEDEYRELLELFLDTSISDLKDLQTAIDQKNHKRAAEASHSIKGASGNLGLEEVYELSKMIEIDARRNIIVNAQARLTAIQDVLNTLSRLLK